MSANYWKRIPRHTTTCCTRHRRLQNNKQSGASVETLTPPAAERLDPAAVIWVSVEKTGEKPNTTTAKGESRKKMPNKDHNYYRNDYFTTQVLRSPVVYR